MKKTLSEKFKGLLPRFAFAVLVCLTAFIAVFDALQPSLYDVSYAADQEEIYWLEYTEGDGTDVVSCAGVEEPTSLYTSDLRLTEGSELIPVYMFRVGVDPLNWLSTLVSNDGLGLISIERTVQFVQVSENTTTHEITRVNRSTTVTVPLTTVSSIVSATFTGVNYKGEAYSFEFNEEPVAGVYRMTNVTISYNFEAITKWGDLSLSGVNAKSGQISVDMSKYKFVLTSQVALNYDLISQYDDNFSIAAENRTYNSEDLSSVIELHHNGNAPAADQVFCFSAGNRNFVSSIGRGFGGFLTSTSDTNLAEIADYLDIVWYRKDVSGDGTIAYTKVDEPIVRNAGTYAVRVETKHRFDYDAFDPLYVIVNSTKDESVGRSAIIDGSNRFAYEITICKAEIGLLITTETDSATGNHVLNEAVGFGVVLSKTYDLKNDASTLFSNINMTDDVWMRIGGYPADCPSVNGRQLFSFDGSVFDNAGIATGKTVYMNLRFNDVAYTPGVSDATTEKSYYITQNYNPVPYANGDKCVYNSIMNGYAVNGLFAITPNELNLHFAGTEDVGKEVFPSSVIYGDYYNYTDFIFKNYIVMPMAKETGLKTGIFEVPYHSDWIIVTGTTGSTIYGNYNTLYIDVISAVQNENTTRPSFVDIDGNKYSTYNDRFYAGEYFFIYSVKAVYVGGADKDLTVDMGQVNVKAQNSDVTEFTIKFDKMQPLSVNRKNVTITVEDIVEDKLYDGTDKVLSYSVKADGILDADKNGILDFVCDVKYAYPGVNTVYVTEGDTTYERVGDVTLIYNPHFVKKSSTILETVFQKTQSSYKIDIDNMVNKVGTGKINPLPLTVEFVLDGHIYSRKYKTETNVAVTGDGIPDGWWYYYATIKGVTLSGFCLEADLDVIFSDSIYVKLKLSGFKEGEGFGFEGSGLEDFMTQKHSSDPTEYTKLTLDANTLLSWYDSLKGVTIDFDTSSSIDGESYRLEVNAGHFITNYEITAKVGNYAYLIVEKRDVNDEIKIKDDNSTNRMEYDKASHVDRLFDREIGKVDITAHPEYATELRERPRADFIYVESFIPDCDEPGHLHDFAQADIDGLVLAGVYRINLLIPETTNYKAYTTSFLVTVNSKPVQVYLTMAMRFYGAAAVGYDNYAYIANIEDYVAYVDPDGNVVNPDNESGIVGNKVYIYKIDGVQTSDNYVLYEGFVGSDVIDETLGDRFATTREELKNNIDAAGSESRVVVENALKHNYKFYYNNVTLYVKRKPLNIEVNESYQKYYTGSQVTLEYTISDNDPGTIGWYVAGYSAQIGTEPAIDPNAQETDTEVIKAGEYILKVFAKPTGPNANNYAVSTDEKEVRVTVHPTELVLAEGSDVAESIYDGDPNGYLLKGFNYYFVGLAKDGSGNILAENIPVETMWGKVKIISVLKDGITLADPKAIDAGVYTVNVCAYIPEAQLNNIYFSGGVLVEITEDGTTAKYLSKEFELTLTIRKAYEYNFSVSPSESISESKSAGIDYEMTYNGYGADDTDRKVSVYFGYNLSISGTSMNNGKLNVIVAVNGYLYSVNGKVLSKLVEADINKALTMANKIGEVNYNIADRTDMRDCGIYNVKYYINYVDSDDYNSNYESCEYEYVFEMQKRALKVYLDFSDWKNREPENKDNIPYKIYATANSDFEAATDKYKFVVEGWAREESMLFASIAVQGMSIDWSETPDNATVSSDCRIRSCGGTVPSENYYFDHSAASVFRILPAESNIIVYGGSDFDKREDLDDEIIYTFDKIYHYEVTESTDGVSVRNVVAYDDISNLTEEEKAVAINGRYYYDYTVYEGNILAPNVLRMAGNVPLNTYEEDVGTDGVKITFIGKLKTGLSADIISALKKGANPDSVDISQIIEQGVTQCKNVGEYVFSVSVRSSQNYKAIPDKYYYFKVTKNMLNVEVVCDKDTYGNDVEVSKIYDGDTIYPSFKIVYSGFMGDDDKYPKYKNVFEIKHVSEYSPTTVSGIEELGLIHPYFEIIDEGKNVILPINVGVYRIRLVITENFGYSENYVINIIYPQDSDGDVYPTLTINKRPVDVVAADNIQKTYDSTVKVPEGIITKTHYSFVPVNGEMESGIVAGDDVGLIIIWENSRFDRATVLDEYGKNSVTVVKVYYYADNVLDNSNYVFRPSVVNSDETGTYISLQGLITPARAEIQFFSDPERQKFISVRYETVYDARPHPVYPLVRGVMTESGVAESVDYTLTYVCERIHYSDSNAPTLAETYRVQLVVNDSNYVSVQRGVELVITKADVTIVFGGDIVQVYGSVGGLFATAFGVDDYAKTLEVLYYDADGNLVPDVFIANAGEYNAVAIHEESANYNHCENSVLFTIKRREVHIDMNVRSYYPYTGRGVNPDIYFDYNNVRYQPALKFFSGDGAPFDGVPVNVGEYFVIADNTMTNFDILDKDKVPFSVTPVSVTVKAKDRIVTLGDEIVPDFEISGAVNGEKLDKIFTSHPTVEYYSTTDGEKIGGLPTEVGVYRIKLIDGECPNYVPTYEYGILTVNNNELKQPVTNSKFAVTGEVSVLGSFSADVSLIVKTTDILEYNQYVTAFESAKISEEMLADYGIIDVYYLKLSNGSITDFNGENMVVKIYARYYFNVFGDDYDGEYMVARISSDGTVNLLKAERDGDYLVFGTDSLEAFALLASADNATLQGESGGNNYDWVLYVGIAVGVVLIAVALIIVKVKA